MNLYEEIAESLNITVKELRVRITKGEPLVHLYYQWKYKWNPKDETTIPF